MVALIALGGVLAITVYAVITAAGDLLLALVSLFLLAFSAWFVLTRRHLARLLGLPGVLVGLLGMIGFVGGHPLELIGLVAVLALFGFAGRYAMSHGRATLQAVHGKAEPARRGVLIINPGSGGEKPPASTCRRRQGSAVSGTCSSSPATISANWPRGQ